MPSPLEQSLQRSCAFLHSPSGKQLRSMPRQRSLECLQVFKASPSSAEEPQPRPLSSYFIIAFIPLLKVACDTKGIHESAAMGLLYFVMKWQYAAAVKSKKAMEYKSSLKPWEKRTLTTYGKVVKYKMETHAPDDLIAKDAKIMKVTQSLNKTPIEYA